MTSHQHHHDHSHSHSLGEQNRHHFEYADRNLSQLPYTTNSFLVK